MARPGNQQGDALDWARDAWCTHHYVMRNKRWASYEDFRWFNQCFASTLLCAPCRQHFLPMVERHPPATLACDSLVDWSVDLHNQVNKRLGKPAFDQAAARTVYADAPERLLPCYVWRFLHRLAAHAEEEAGPAWSEENKQCCTELLTHIQRWLPDAKALLLQNYLDIYHNMNDNNQTLLYHIHNRVNLECGKPPQPKSVLDTYKLGGCGVGGTQPQSPLSSHQASDISKANSTKQKDVCSQGCAHKWLIASVILTVSLVVVGIGVYVGTHLLKKKQRQN